MHVIYRGPSGISSCIGVSASGSLRTWTIKEARIDLCSSRMFKKDLAAKKKCLTPLLSLQFLYIHHKNAAYWFHFSPFDCHVKESIRASVTNGKALNGLYRSTFSQLLQTKGPGPGLKPGFKPGFKPGMFLTIKTPALTTSVIYNLPSARCSARVRNGDLKGGQRSCRHIITCVSHKRLLRAFDFACCSADENRLRSRAFPFRLLKFAVVTKSV